LETAFLRHSNAPLLLTMQQPGESTQGLNLSINLNQLA